MLTIRTYCVPLAKQPEATLRIELRDHGPAGVFGVRLSSTGAEVSHEPPERPDAVLVTRTAALIAAFDRDDMGGLERADIVGDHEVVRSLMTRVRIPSCTDQD